MSTVGHVPAEGTADPLVAAVREAARFVRENSCEALTLGDIADSVGYSAYHFARAFTGAVGVPPIRYLAVVRFHAAKRLLLTESLGVHEVCHEVGFTSPGTFARRFREQVGVAPGSLRRLAEEVAETTPAPFRLAPTGGPEVVRVRVHVPPTLGPQPLVWLGLFSTPMPAGMPGAGVLRRGSCEVALPVTPGHPWLLATTLPQGADPVTQLADDAPLVAVHPAPILAPTMLDLRFRPAEAWEVPILTALPALRPAGRRPTP